jgi:hypothetical protein
MSTAMGSWRQTLRRHLSWLARLNVPLSGPSDEGQIDIQINIRVFGTKVYFHVLS